MKRIAAPLALAALLSACGNIQSPPFPPFARAPQPTEFDAIASNPGVYAGQPVLLLGALSVNDSGQACLVDRNRQIAVRLTADQAALLSPAQNWPVSVEGVFQQHLCPPGYVCPEFCTPYGVESGARITDLVPGQ